MSDKDRQKKDGRNKDKKNQAARERENDRKQGAHVPEQARDQSNRSDRFPGPSRDLEVHKKPA